MHPAVDLTDARRQHLTAIADRQQVSPETLASAAQRDRLAHGGADVEAPPARVLEKNAESYRRQAAQVTRSRTS